MQVWLLPGFPVCEAGNCDPYSLQRDLGHHRPEARPHAETKLQDDTSVLQLAGRNLSSEMLIKIVLKLCFLLYKELND